MLTKLLRKRGTGQGAVQESNPNIAQRESKPSSMVFDKIHPIIDAVHGTIGSVPNQERYNEHANTLQEAMKSHFEGNYSEAHKKLKGMVKDLHNAHHNASVKEVTPFVQNTYKKAVAGLGSLVEGYGRRAVNSRGKK
jgi:hypothetical protein